MPKNKMQQKGLALMTDKTKYLTQQQEYAITLLIGGMDRTKVAESVGVSRQALYDWMNKDLFMDEMNRRQHEIAEAGNNFLISKGMQYLMELDDIARNSKDMRTKASVNEYLVDRVFGKSPNSVIVDDNIKTDQPSIDDIKHDFLECRYNVLDDNNKDDA